MSTPGPSRRKTGKQRSAPSTDESIFDELEEDKMTEEDKSSNKIQDVNESLSSMTAEETAQHIKLCLKLSAENKINLKNAFGLHLIGIMQKMVQDSGKTDIQQASMSLQASSKIYTGRVDALYLDTCKFHGHLQSLVTGSKKDKKGKNTDEGTEDSEDDNSENRKSKPQKSKCKSFLKPEESLSMEQDVSTLTSQEPHGNFVTINSAFSTSRLAPKLLNSLQLACDSCMLRSAVPEKCFKAKCSSNNLLYACPPKMKGILEKIKNFSFTQSENQGPLSDVPYASHFSTPKPVSPSRLFDDEDVFAVPFDAGPSNDANSVDSAIERFDVLNITASAFVNDIAAAITDQGVDHTLLPPNSALKKMLDRSSRKSSVKPVGKTTKQKIKEPFFAGRSADGIRHLFVKGKSATLTEKSLSKWSKGNTTVMDGCYAFIQELEKRKEKGYEFKTTADQLLDIIKPNNLEYNFKCYFNKQSQMYKISRRQLQLNESFAGPNQTERRVASIAPTDPDGLAVSFQNLSLHDSMHDIPDTGGNESFDEPPDLGDTEEPQFVVALEAFETDIDELMVKPPELVRPASVKFDQKPVNLDTKKIKDFLWLFISKHIERNSNSGEVQDPFVLFSSIYKDLKLKVTAEMSEHLSVQYAFVVLLMLANERTLRIDNVEGGDISIKQDVAEIDITDNM